MTLFWISTVVLTLIACALVALPLLKQKANNDEVLRDELNKAFYKDRLSELAEETDEGLVESQDDLILSLLKHSNYILNSQFCPRYSQY